MWHFCRVAALTVLFSGGQLFFSSLPHECHWPFAFVSQLWPNSWQCHLDQRSTVRSISRIGYQWHWLNTKVISFLLQQHKKFNSYVLCNPCGYVGGWCAYVHVHVVCVCVPVSGVCESSAWGAVWVGQALANFTLTRPNQRPKIETLGQAKNVSRAKLFLSVVAN